MFPIVPGLIADALQRVARGDKGEVQDENDATYAGPFDTSWRIINWANPVRTIHNQVRSWSGNRGIEAGAIGEIDGVRHTILRTRLATEHTDSAHPIGSRIDIGAEGTFVQCGDGLIEILATEPAAIAVT